MAATIEEIEAIIAEHKEAPHLRVLQKALAEDITVRVHDEASLERAIGASQALFSKSIDGIRKLDVRDFLDVFEGVEMADVSSSDLEEGLGIIDALAGKTGFLKSNGEARRELKGNAIAVNKQKVNDQYVITREDLIHDKYVLLSKGKKTNFILSVV